MLLRLLSRVAKQEIAQPWGAHWGGCRLANSRSSKNNAEGSSPMRLSWCTIASAFASKCAVFSQTHGGSSAIMSPLTFASPHMA